MIAIITIILIVLFCIIICLFEGRNDHKTFEDSLKGSKGRLYNEARKQAREQERIYIQSYENFLNIHLDILYNKRIMDQLFIDECEKVRIQKRKYIQSREDILAEYLEKFDEDLDDDEQMILFNEMRRKTNETYEKEKEKEN